MIRPTFNPKLAKMTYEKEKQVKKSDTLTQHEIDDRHALLKHLPEPYRTLAAKGKYMPKDGQKKEQTMSILK